MALGCAVTTPCAYHPRQVWRWPGKGVYAIFGRKPQRNGTDRFCRGLIVYHQWLVQVTMGWDLSWRKPLKVQSNNLTFDGSRPLQIASDEAGELSAASGTALRQRGKRSPPADEGDDDPWILRTPLPLLPSRDHQYPKQAKHVTEKNWMPFVHKVGVRERRMGFDNGTIWEQAIENISREGTPKHKLISYG